MLGATSTSTTTPTSGGRPRVTIADTVVVVTMRTDDKGTDVREVPLPSCSSPSRAAGAIQGSKLGRRCARPSASSAAMRHFATSEVALLPMPPMRPLAYSPRK